jgi:hypothetical protein
VDVLVYAMFVNQFFDKMLKNAIILNSYNIAYNRLWRVLIYYLMNTVFVWNVRALIAI